MEFCTRKSVWRRVHEHFRNNHVSYRDRNSYFFIFSFIASLCFLLLSFELWKFRFIIAVYGTATKKRKPKRKREAERERDRAYLRARVQPPCRERKKTWTGRRIPTRRVMRTYQHRSACYLLSNGYHTTSPTADEARNAPQARPKSAHIATMLCRAALLLKISLAIFHCDHRNCDLDFLTFIFLAFSDYHHESNLNHKSRWWFSLRGFVRYERSIEASVLIVTLCIIIGFDRI